MNRLECNTHITRWMEWTNVTDKRNNHVVLGGKKASFKLQIVCVRALMCVFLFTSMLIWIQESRLKWPLIWKCVFVHVCVYSADYWERFVWVHLHYFSSFQMDYKTTQKYTHLSKNVFSPCVLIGCDGMLTCLFKMTENTSTLQGESHFWDRLSHVIGSVITSTHLESEAAASQSW